MMRPDVHEYSRRIDRFLKNLEKNDRVPEQDKLLLRRFRDILASDGLSQGRISKHLFDLTRASELLAKRFEEANEHDIRRIVVAFDEKGDLSPWTKRDFMVSLRKFYTWLRGTGSYPPEVAWMKVYKRIKNTRTAEEMLTEEDVIKLIEAAETPQSKALIATMYESGCRIGELIYMNINQIKFDEYGAQLFVNGKTGFRRVRVVACVSYLTDWLNRHPHKNDPEARLWLNYWLRPCKYAAALDMLHRISAKAGVNKRINPHNFRHSRATYLANHLTDAQMKEHFGWTQDSKMAGVYIHLSGRDVDSALLKVYGIASATEKKESALKPKECSRCNLSNSPTNLFCSRCGLPLDEAAKAAVLRKDLERKDADDVLDMLIEDQEFRNILIKKIQSMKQISNPEFAGEPQISEQ